MMNCLAESLIASNGFNPIDLRVRFSAWVYFGYCNAFGYNEVPRASVGLGNMINLSVIFLKFRCLSCRWKYFAFYSGV